MTKPTPSIDTIVFDLGGVLIDWNPRHLYRKLFDNENDMESFLSQVCNAEWNYQVDRGKPWPDAIREAIRRFPEKEALIRAYHDRWEEMLNGAIDGTVSLLAELKTTRLHLFALTNWSEETFVIAENRFAFLKWFEGILVSGREKLAKPDPAIFQLLLARYQFSPGQAIFIDDQPYNVAAAIKEGFHAIRFSNAAQLRRDLRTFGVPLKE